MSSQAGGVPVLCGFVKLWSREGTLAGCDDNGGDDNLQGGPPNDHIAIAGISPFLIGNASAESGSTKCR